MNLTGKSPDKKHAIARRAMPYLFSLSAFGLVLAIFLSSLVHPDGTTPGFGFIGLIRPDLQSGLHIPMFFGLTVILLIFLKRFEKRKYNLILFVFVMANYVGMLNEGLQALIPDRNPSMGDLGLNLLGTILGLGFYFGIRSWRSARKEGRGEIRSQKSEAGGRKSEGQNRGKRDDGRKTRGKTIKFRG